MRLLNTATHNFEEFFDANIPSYAILSHRWESKEISFQELSKLRKHGKLPDSSSKIMRCAELARIRGHQWIWVDTCCIDKRSSAELSEAINSMFHWYEQAVECYAYLSDVNWVDHTCSHERSLSHFRSSAWFTRGWTLQELLAPPEVIFFDENWNEIGSKIRLSPYVSEATGIEERFLRSNWEVERACIAQRMSWASKRVTSRREDAAYCLLGLFDVNMPLLYGEGDKAFLRLQLEIIKMSDDESIFAWDSSSGQPLFNSGMLAGWPSDFANAGDIVIPNILGCLDERPMYSMTNKGLELRIPAGNPGLALGARQITLPLRCARRGSDLEEQSTEQRTARSEVTMSMTTITLDKAGNTWRRNHRRGSYETTIRPPVSASMHNTRSATVYVWQDLGCTLAGIPISYS